MRFSLRVKLTVLILIILLPLIGVIAYNIVHSFDDLQSEEVDAHLDQAELKSAAVTRLFHELSAISATAGFAIIEGEVAPREADSFLDSVKESIEEGGFEVSYLLVAAPDGKVIATTNPELRGKNPATDDAFKKARDGADFSVTNLITNLDGNLGFSIFSRIKKGSDVIGVADVAMESSQFRRILPVEAAHGVVLVTDRSGRLIYSNERALSDLPPTERDFGDRQFVKTALAGNNFTTRGMALPVIGGEYLGAQVPVKTAGWTLGVYTPAGEALAHVFDELRITIAIIIAITATIIGSAIIYGRGISRPITELSKASNEIAKGNFDVQIIARTRDEIGDLASNFDSMKDSLKSALSDLRELMVAARRVNIELEMSTILTVAVAYLKSIMPTKAIVATAFEETRSAEHAVIATDGVDRERGSDLFNKIERVAGAELVDKGYLFIDLEEPGAGELREERRLSRFLLILPLVVKGEPVGRIDIFTEQVKPLSEFMRVEVRLATTFAQQVAVGILNARLFKEQRAIADVLQDSLLTEPEYIPGLEVGVDYRPTTAGARIGGDFYDLFSITEEKAVVIVGDISGKGLEAAAFTSIAKGAIRSFAIEKPDPHEVFSRANRVIAEQTSAEVFITAVYALINTRDGTVSYSIAGHPPPMLYSKRFDRVFFLGGLGVPLGAFIAERFSGMQVRIQPGDKLVFYTDGLTEAKSNGELLGEARVAAALYELKETPAIELASALAERALEFTGGRLTDDLAIIAIELKPA